VTSIGRMTDLRDAFSGDDRDRYLNDRCPSPCVPG
jgi:hypothetical protein